MTIAVNQVVSATDSGGADEFVTVAISDTLAGAALEVTIGHISNNSVVAVTDSQGNTYAQVSNHPVADGTLFYAIDRWVAQDIVGGASANTITVEFSFAQSNFSVHAKEIRGGKTSSLVLGATGQNQTAPTTGTDALTSGNVNVTAQPALLSGFAVELTSAANTPAAGTGFTSDATATNTFAAAFPWRTTSNRVTATGNQAATFTAAANTRHLVSVIAYEEFAGVDKAASDTASLSATEGSTDDVSVNTLDTASVSVADVSALAATLSRADTTSVSVSDGSSLSVSNTTTPDVLDTTSLTLTEVGSVGVSIVVTETTSLATTDAGTVDVTALIASVTDTASLSGGDFAAAFSVGTTSVDVGDSALLAIEDAGQLIATFPVIISRHGGRVIVPFEDRKVQA